MENLYHGQKSFEWFRLLSFLSIDSGPKPLNASECGRQAGVLVGQFENKQIRQVGDIVNLNRLERKHFADEKVKEEVCRRAQAEVLETLEALFRYAPSVDAMARLLQNIEHELGQATSELAVGMFQRRLRTLHFGQKTGRPSSRICCTPCRWWRVKKPQQLSSTALIIRARTSQLWRCLTWFTG